MEIKKITDEFYQDKVFRKLKWTIETIYGSPDKIILCYRN